MKVIRHLACLLAVAMLFTSVAADDKTPADTTVNREITEEALEQLWVVSDTLQARIIKGLAESDPTLLEGMIPTDLGIVMPDRGTLDGYYVNLLMDSHVMPRIGGTAITAERHSHNIPSGNEGWVREKLMYEMTIPNEDSTTTKMIGHFLLNWQLEDGQWHWRTLFIGKRQ